MKAMSTTVSYGMEIGSRLVCSDNSGAKIIEIIGVKKYKGVRRRRHRAGVGSHLKVKIIQGTQKVAGEMFDATIIRQKRSYRRSNGLTVSFQDNACVLLDDGGLPKGSKIKGPVAKEAIERFPGLGKVATMVI